MLRKLQPLKKMGIGIVGLAVVLLAAAPAKAELWRSDWKFDTLVPIFSFVFDGQSVTQYTIGTETFDDLGGGFVHWHGTGFQIDTGEFQQILNTLILPNAQHDYVTFAASFTGTDPLLLDRLEINGKTLDGQGNFFYGLEELLLSNKPVVFNFGSDFNRAYTFTIYGSETAIPEPATLAIVGLGLAGLGVARRRRQ